MRLSRFLQSASFLFCLSCAGHAFAVPLTPNLLTNPGAETGTTSGWTVTGAAATDKGSLNPGINPRTGTYDFVGFSGASSSLSQTVSLLSNGFGVAQLDSGSVLAYLSFWEQSLSQTPSDTAGVSLSFLNSLGGVISTVSSGQIDSHNNTWSNYSNSYVLPTGTRSISYTMNFTRNSGTSLDAYIDDNSLMLTPPTAVTPEPSSLLLIGTATLSGAGLLRRRRKLAVA